MPRFLAFVFRNQMFLLVALGTLAVASCAGLFGLTVTSDTRVFFAPDNPHLQQLDNFDRTYTQNNNILLIATAKKGTMLEPDNLAALLDLTERSWLLPHSSRVDGFTNFTDIETEDDDIAIGDLVAHGAPWDESELDHYSAVATTDPQVANRFISRDLHTAGININFTLPDKGSQAINEINAAAHALADDFAAQYPNMDVYVTGNVALMQVFSLAAMRDVRLLLPVSLAVILLVMVLTLRSFQETLTIAALLALSSAMATSLLGWLNHPIDIATVVAPVIIMTLAMAGFIHIVTAIHRLMRDGMDQRDAIVEGLGENFHPITLTSLTTAIGFLALNFADAPPFNYLGNLVILGIAINYIFTFTLFPILFNRLRLKVRESSAPTEPNRIVRMLQVNSYPILIVGGILILTSSLGITQINLDDDFIRYFDKSFSYRVASDVAEERLTGLNIIEFDLPAGEEDGIFDPEYQRNVDAFLTWIRAQDKVASATAITDYTRKLYRHLDPEGAAQTPLPTERSQIAQFYLLMDMSLPEGRSLSDVISTDQSSSRLTLILRNATSGDIRTMNERASTWLKTHAPEMATTGISINVLFSHLSITNIRSMISGTIISFVLISMVIALLLRSIKLGAISLLANSIPALVGFGLWGLLVGTVNLGASVLVAMTLGIVVDDTIHYLSAFRTRLNKGMDPTRAAADALQKIGPAMIITTVSLIAGFAVMTLSGFDVNKTLGLFTAIIIAAALIADLLLLPALLSLTHRKT